MSEDKRQNEIIRIQKKRNNFVMLDKGFLEDNRLSYKAKGILAYLLSKPDNWKVIIKDLINHSSDGKKAIYSGLRELKQHGYYRKMPIRNEKGQRIIYWESVIFECPEDQSEQSILQLEENNENILLTPKGEIDKNPDNSTFPLFTPFVHIENVQIQNEEIQNGQHSNNYSNKNYSTEIIKSESTSEETEKVIHRHENENDVDDDNDFLINEQTSTDNKNKEPLVSTTNQSTEIKSSLPNHTDDSKPSVYDYNTYKKILQDHIEYNHYLTYRKNEIDLIDELVDCMLDVVCTNGTTVKINGEDKNRQMVIAQYLKINSSDIDFVLQKYKEQQHKITHIHNYLKTILYNVKQEAGHYYTNAVRVDGFV